MPLVSLKPGDTDIQCALAIEAGVQGPRITPEPPPADWITLPSVTLRPNNSPIPGPSSHVTGIVLWDDDFEIRLRENLLDWVLLQLDRAAAALAGATTGNFGKVISQLGDIIHDLLAKTSRQIKVGYEFSCTIGPGEHLLFVEHREQYTLRWGTAITPNNTKLRGGFHTTVNINGERDRLYAVDLFGRDSGLANGPVVEQDVAIVHGPSFKVELETTAWVEFAGFADDLQVLADHLVELVRLTRSTAGTVKDALIDVAKRLGAAVGLGEDEQDDLGDLDSVDAALTAIKDLLGKAISTALDDCTTVVNQWLGLVKMEHSRVDLTCITLAAYDRILALLPARSTSLQRVMDEPDGRVAGSPEKRASAATAEPDSDRRGTRKHDYRRKPVLEETSRVFPGTSKVAMSLSHYRKLMKAVSNGQLVTDPSEVADAPPEP